MQHDELLQLLLLLLLVSKPNPKIGLDERFSSLFRNSTQTLHGCIDISVEYYIRLIHIRRALVMLRDIIVVIINGERKDGSVKRKDGVKQTQKREKMQEPPYKASLQDPLSARLFSHSYYSYELSSSKTAPQDNLLLSFCDIDRVDPTSNNNRHLARYV